MAINPPAERIWWKEPVHKLELLWVVIGLVWAIVMFLMMPYWHIVGGQNLSDEAYRINPEAFAANPGAPGYRSRGFAFNVGVSVTLGL